MPAGDDVRYERHPAHDGEVLAAGPMRLRVLHTPGHTHHHVSYVLTDADGAVQAVFTGGSMLYGATGRTDLLGAEHTQALTHAQFHSVRRLAAELPPGTAVFPTHGFGSFCSATPTSGTESTLGEQARVNPALTQDEQAFVDELIGGLGAYPAYYARMGPANAARTRRRSTSPCPRRVDPAELRRPHRRRRVGRRPPRAHGVRRRPPARHAELRARPPTSSPTSAGSTTGARR